MKLSVKAARLVERAVRDTTPAFVPAWMEQANRGEFSRDSVRHAYDALRQFESWLKQRFERDSLDEDQRSDLINDIRLVSAIQNDLQREISSGQHLNARCSGAWHQSASAPDYHSIP